MTPMEHLTTAQAAKQLRLTVGAVNRLVLIGELTPAMKLPGRTGAYLFSPFTIDDLAAVRAAR